MDAIDVVNSEEYRRRYVFRLSLKHSWLKKRKSIQKTVSGNGIRYEEAAKMFLETVKIPRNYYANSLHTTIITG